MMPQEGALRFISTVLASGALGSLVATSILVLVSGGVGAPSSVRFILSFALETMIFTAPGALMLVGLRAGLRERAISLRSIDVLTEAFGATAGAVILVYGGMQGTVLGLIYGLCTAVALTLLERIISGP